MRELDVDVFLPLLAAIAKRALSDTLPSRSAARRAEAEAFLSYQLPNWRSLWSPRPQATRGRRTRRIVSG